MDFDPSTAVPVDDKRSGKFDPSTATLANPPLDKSSNVVGAGARAQNIVNKLRGLDDDVDYQTGAAPIAKMWLGRSDNPKEAELALTNYYGKGNVGKDSGGRYWVKINGKKTEVYGGGQGFKTGMTKLGYDMLNYSPVLGGAAMGAVSGGVVAPESGPIGPVIGAGGGAAVGSALEELQKHLMGFYAKTPQEEVAKFGNDAIFNAAFEGLGPTAKAILKPIKNSVREFLGLTKPVENMTHALVKEGAKVPVQTGLPGAKVLAFHSDLRTRVMGDPKEAHNVAFVRAQLVNLLKEAGHSQGEIDSIMSEVTEKESAQSTTATGEKVTQAVSSYKSALEKEANSAVATAKAGVEDEVKNLTTIRTDPANLGQDAARTIQLARRKFGMAMSRAYSSIDEMTGGAKLVQRDTIRQATLDALKSLPETNRPEILKRIITGNAPYSFMEAHALRSDMRVAADSANLTRDPLAHAYGTIADAIDGAMSRAGADLAAKGETNAAKALRTIDSSYREGIGKFKDAVFRQIVRRAQTGIFPEPSAIASQLIKPDEIGRLETFMKIAPPSVRAKVAAADMQNLLKAAKGNDEGFLTEITKRGKTLDIVYGKETASKLRTAAKELAALDGKLPANMSIDAGRTADALKQQAAYLKMQDSFVEKNPMAALTNPRMADRAVHVITMPGKESVTLAARDFLGPESPEWKAIQKEALKKLLSAAIERSPSLDSKVVGDAMKNQLGKYTRKQLDALFPNDLDRDLRILADKANFLFPNAEGEMAAGLAAGVIKAGMPVTFPAYFYAKFWGWIADHPQWFYRLAGAAQEKDPSDLKLISRTIMSVALKSATAPTIGSQQ